MKNCYLCGKKDVVQILDLGNQPICHRFLPTSTEEEFTHPIWVGQCGACGLVQLLQPFPIQELVPWYDWLTNTEPEDHLDGVVRTMSQLPGISKESKICGLSFKEDTTLERFNQLGFDNTWRIDPQKELGINHPLASVETIQEQLTLEMAESLVETHGQSGIVIARHILEHATNIRQFMKAVRTLVHPQGYVVFEIPDCQRAFEKCDYTTIWEEHVIYFTPETFRNFFGFGGLSLIHFEKASYSLEDSYIGIAQINEDVPSPFPNEQVLTEEIHRAQSFADELSNKRRKLKKYLSTYQQEKGKIALFGAAHMGCAFVNFLEVRDYINFVVDDNPHKCEMFMPGSWLPIRNSQSILDEDIKLCLLTLSPTSEKKVLENNQDFLAKGGQFTSIFPGSKLALSV